MKNHRKEDTAGADVKETIDKDLQKKTPYGVVWRKQSDKPDMEKVCEKKRATLFIDAAFQVA